jgi:hypothetical protein
MIYVFTCPKEHKEEVFKAKPYKREVRKRCKKCGLWAHRDFRAEHYKGTKEINLDYNNDPISHLVKKDGFKGIMIENLTPTPVFIRNKAQYEKLLKSTHSLENPKR